MRVKLHTLCILVGVTEIMRRIDGNWHVDWGFSLRYNVYGWWLFRAPYIFHILRLILSFLLVHVGPEIISPTEFMYGVLFANIDRTYQQL